MLTFPLIVVLGLAGCNDTCGPLEEAALVDLRPKDVDAWTEAVQTFSGWFDDQDLCIEAVVGQPEIHTDDRGGGHLEKLCGGARCSTIVIDNDYEYLYTYKVMMHQICHAIDWQKLTPEDVNKISDNVNTFYPYSRRPATYNPKKELFAELCSEGPELASRIVRFADACGYDDYAYAAQLLLDEVFAPFEDDQLTPANWPTTYAGAATSPRFGDRFHAPGGLSNDTISLLFGNGTDGGVRLWRRKFGGAEASPEEEGPASRVPEYVDALGRGRGVGALGGEVLVHPALPPVAELFVQVPGGAPALIPVIATDRGFQPFDGVCARPPANPEPLTDDDLYFYDEGVPGSLSFSRWPGGLPRLEVRADEDGVWLFQEVDGGGVRWFHVPLDLPTKLPPILERDPGYRPTAP